MKIRKETKKTIEMGKNACDTSFIRIIEWDGASAYFFTSVRYILYDCTLFNIQHSDCGILDTGYIYSNIFITCIHVLHIVSSIIYIRPLYVDCMNFLSSE